MISIEGIPRADLDCWTSILGEPGWSGIVSSTESKWPSEWLKEVRNKNIQIQTKWVLILLTDYYLELPAESIESIFESEKKHLETQKNSLLF